MAGLPQQIGGSVRNVTDKFLPEYPTDVPTVTQTKRWKLNDVMERLEQIASVADTVEENYRDTTQLYLDIRDIRDDIRDLKRLLNELTEPK